MFHTARVFEEMVWFHPGFLHHSRLQRSPTKQAPGLWTCCRLSRRRHVTKATHTHARTLATSTSSANRAAAAALRCSLTGFNVFSFFFLLLVEKEKSDTGTGHPQGDGSAAPSTPLGRGRWRSVATAPALAMHWRALQSRLHRGKSGDSVSSTADGPATLFSSRSEQGADVTFTPPPPRPPGVFQRSRVGSLLGVSSAHLTVDGARPIRRNNGERASKRKKPVLRWPGGYAVPPPPHAQNT